MRKSRLQDILSKEILEYEYEIAGSMQKVADKLNVSIDSVYKYMKLHNIPYCKTYQGIYECNENIFDTDTEASFYLAGFIAADGSLQERKYSKILKITLSKTDDEHLQKIKKILNSTHPIKEYLVKPSRLVQTSNMCVELQIANNKIFDDLARFNIVPNKTKIYTFPKLLIGHPLINHFMRGYFDGDGCISYCGLGPGRTIKQKLFHMIGTMDFVENYRNELIKNCNIGEAKITKHSSIFSIQYSGNNVVKKIFNFLYKDAIIYLDRKYQKFIV